MNNQEPLSGHHWSRWPDPTAEHITDLLVQEVTSLDAQITQLLPKMDSFFGLVIAAIAGAITLGVTNHVAVILVGLPVVLFIVITALVQATTEMLSRAGYKRALEEHVNKLVRHPILLQEQFVAPGLQGQRGWTVLGRTSVAMLQTFLIAILLATIAVAWLHLPDVLPLHGKHEAVAHMRDWRAARIYLIGGFIVVVAAGGIMLRFALHEQAGAYRQAYGAARAGLGGAAPPVTALLREPRRRLWFDRDPRPSHPGVPPAGHDEPSR